MADKLGLGPEIKELRLGNSFTNKGSAFHTFRCRFYILYSVSDVYWTHTHLLLPDDFKPASVDTSKMATVDILQNNEVNVTVPHCDGAGTSFFRGPKKPYAKECVLIIDHSTGEITLERLSHNIQLKKTRYEIEKLPRNLCSLLCWIAGQQGPRHQLTRLCSHLNLCSLSLERYLLPGKLLLLLLHHPLHRHHPHHYPPQGELLSEKLSWMFQCFTALSVWQLWDLPPSTRKLRVRGAKGVREMKGAREVIAPWQALLLLAACLSSVIWISCQWHHPKR